LQMLGEQMTASWRKCSITMECMLISKHWPDWPVLSATIGWAWSRRSNCLWTWIVKLCYGSIFDRIYNASQN
jgi:hypothetical protein